MKQKIEAQQVVAPVPAINKMAKLQTKHGPSSQLGQPKQLVRGRVADDEQSMTSNNITGSNIRHFDSFGGFSSSLKALSKSEYSFFDKLRNNLKDD